ncbi:carboxymuconolactone decarboxylase family protein [Novosphingobium sp. ERN07]|uniref:carboxymuconolactone decarboxylase family protein n=1 Tax=Novosphingobium sp. ERN07 TaxID=2726187 RepID=UPI001456587E|nr:carboxymuconolactone decarboxylase family protein [Novosphingobium sp. ERN07]NLR73185.1 carboxymuconolactone decarboxylase family protein [Novosphingobium sp. ERN07]
MARINLPTGPGEERERMWMLRPEMGAAADAFSAAVQDRSTLTTREQEAARTRIAHINRCVPCTDARIDNMAEHGLDEAFYAGVDAPDARYSAREKLAIDYASRFAAGSEAFDDAFWAELRAAFDDGEIVDLTAGCAKWLGLGRINAVLDLQRSCPIRLRPSALANAS